MLEAGRGTSTKSASRGTIQQLVDIYFSSPRRSSQVVAKGNVSRLLTIVRLVHGKEMKDVPIAALSAKLWSEYQRLRLEQAGLPLDYSRRIAEAHSINSAIRQAMSLVSRPSQVAYAAHGITLPSDASTIMQLPEPILIKPPANDDALVTAWRQLRDVDRPLWLALGLARFAGMRREEIVNCRGKWIVTHEGVVSVELRDRPEDRYQTKTGRPYFAPILDADLAAVLSSIKPEQLVVDPEGVARGYWFITVPQQWCRPYVSDVQKPLHRLRGLYAVDLRIRTRDAVAAALAGTKAASAALSIEPAEPFTQCRLTLNRPAVADSGLFFDFFVRLPAATALVLDETFDIDSARIGLFRTSADPSPPSKHSPRATPSTPLR